MQDLHSKGKDIP